LPIVNHSQFFLKWERQEFSKTPIVLLYGGTVYGGSSILRNVRPFIMFYRVASRYTTKFEAVLYKKQNARVWGNFIFQNAPQSFTLATHSLNIGEKSHEVFTYSFVLGSSSLVNHGG
jgi:hypothetical protein